MVKLALPFVAIDLPLETILFARVAGGVEDGALFDSPVASTASSTAAVVLAV